MTKRWFLLLTAFMVQLFIYAQSKNEFASFAARQDSLFVKAYEQKDIPKYESLLSEFEKRYQQLEKPSRDRYLGNRINAYYNLSCTYSLLHQNKAALDNLERSIQLGYNNYAHLLEDNDLDNIRKEKRFADLLAAVRETGDYLFLLKKAAGYDSTDHRPVPVFTYQNYSDSNLVKLRTALNLDSIAGRGNEISQLLSLMHWLHNLVPHDGNHENPAVKNAMSLISECKKNKRGLNCRGLATVLNECYLSMGWRSRMVTCLPKDSLGIDPDCHVIIAVYSNSLDKWIWIDPTFDAYVMNEKGEMLGIEEVRTRIIKGAPLIINPEANWNHLQSETINQYLYNYMAKNLYLLQCAANSSYDLETRQPGKTIEYIQLAPPDYFKQSKGKTVSTNNQTKTTLVNYTTNNSELFWSKPN